MILAIKSSFLIGVILLLLTVNTSAQETPSKAELVGRYYSGHNFGGSSVTLKADGTYTDSSGSCTYSTKESGTFVVSDGAVRFKILKYTGNHHGDEPEVDLFDNQARKAFFGYRDDQEVAPIVTEYALVPVKWGKRIYLLDEKSFDDFTDAINLGFEPRDDLRSEPYAGMFYLRDGDERKPVSGIPSLPREWSALLLKNPVTATVVSIYGNQQETIAIINKGSRDGLRVGIKLISNDEKPLIWAMSEVISVEETFARVRVVGETKVGSKLATKYTRKDTY